MRGVDHFSPDEGITVRKDRDWDISEAVKLAYCLLVLGRDFKASFVVKTKW